MNGKIHGKFWDIIQNWFVFLTILEILKQQSDWISGQELATAFGLNGNSKIEEIEQFYEQLRTLSLDDKIMVKPDQQNNKEQDLIKLKDKTDAS